MKRMPSPRGDELYGRALERMPGGSTRSTIFVAPHPPYALRGEGCEVVDVDGHRTIDLQNNHSALVHGHAFAPVARAAAAAIEQGAAFGLPTPSEVELAEELAGRVGWAQRWRFTSSGTEAVMMAVRAARAATGRDAVVRFAGCYHGSWDAVAEPGARGVPDGVRGDVVTVPLGEEAALVAALDERDGEVAAVLLDPLPNGAGMPLLAESFVRLVREQTRRRGIVLVLDEVICFRLATGGLHSLYGIEGDLIVLGKLIGGGLPVGALGGREEPMAVFDPRAPGAVVHGGTFSANPVSMSAGLAALRAYGQAQIDRIDRLGDTLRAGLRERGWAVSGRGSLLKVTVRERAALWWRLYEAGVLIAANGLMCISTPMDERIVARVLDAFDRAGREPR
jgi:glutamate-1-semialdehyde 2,1-aminomutase